MRNVLCIIVDVEPFASLENPQDPAECFPPCLIEALAGESQSSDRFLGPLAADLRTEGDGPRLASLKLIAGLLGIGLDEIIRRDVQRRNRRMAVLTITSTIIAIAMGLLAAIAFDAREQEAARRADAEDD